MRLGWFLDTSRAQDYAQALQIAPQLVKEERDAAVTEMTMLLEAEVKDLTPVGVYGALRGSITSELRGEAGNVEGLVFSPLNYAAAVELGTRPHWAPLDPLITWVEKKLGLPEEEAKAVGRLVQFKIAAKGTKAQAMFSRAVEVSRARFSQIIEQGMARVRERLAQIRN